MKAWLFQDHRQRKNLGDRAPWSVGWYDPDGKKRSRRIGSKSLAEKFQRKIEGQLAAGTYQDNSRKTWREFRDEYDSKILGGAAFNSSQATKFSIDAFERISKPARVSSIKTRTLDDFVVKRREDPGVKPGSTVSPATINKDLRHLKAMLRVAHDWGYLARVPKFRMLREPDKLPRFVTSEHFAAMYQACHVAKRPQGLPYSPEAWWQALLVFIYMTGWRIGEPLALRRDDLDLEKGRAITRHGDNKGNRDEIVGLHPVVISHLEKIPSFEPAVFPWYFSRRPLYSEFQRIQAAAGIEEPFYGFHDLRRAFATENESLTPDELQGMMRHKSYLTTKRYINMARRLNQTVEKLHVPDVLKHYGKA